MLERLRKDLRDSLESKKRHLTDGAAKDYTQYAVMAAEVRMLSSILEKMEKEILEDDE